MKPIAATMLLFYSPLFHQDKAAGSGRELIVAAITAHGGAEYFTKKRTGVLRVINKIQGGPLESLEEYFDIPTRWKTVTIGKIGGETKKTIRGNDERLLLAMGRRQTSTRIEEDPRSWKSI